MKNSQAIIILSFFAIVFSVFFVSPGKVWARDWIDTKGDVTLTNSPDSVVVVTSGEHTIEEGNLTINPGVTLQLSAGAVFHFCPGKSITVNGYITVPAHDNRRIVKSHLHFAWCDSAYPGGYNDELGRGCWRAALSGKLNDCMKHLTGSGVGICDAVPGGACAVTSPFWNLPEDSAKCKTMCDFFFNFKPDGSTNGCVTRSGLTSYLPYYGWPGYADAGYCIRWGGGAAQACTYSLYLTGGSRICLCTK